MKSTTKQPEFPLVALDLGSSSLKAMAAVSLPDERLMILGVEQSRKFDCISKGRVTNTSSAGYLFSEVLKLLANRIGQAAPFPSAFAAIGGKSMGCVSVPAKRTLPFKPVIGDQVINQLADECKAKFKQRNADYDIMALRPAFYQIDGEMYGAELPENTHGEDIQAMFTCFYGDNQMHGEVDSSFARSTAELESAFPRPMALLEALASEQDEELGLAILDLGADTTTITVYKAGEFLKSKTIALGGRNITADIQQLHISYPNAEALKMRFGEADERYLEKNPTLVVPSSVQGEEAVRLPLALLTQVIHSRLDEILQEPLKILREYEQEISVVYITGGASRLGHVVEYIDSLTPLPVMYGSHADWLDDSNPDEVYAPEYAALVGSILLARKYRKNHQPPAPRKKSDKIIKQIVDLFTDQQ